MSLIAELQRRKVFKVGAAYLVAAWIAVQAASIGFPAFDAPPWVLRVFILIALLGFPIAVALAWVFDITPEGVKFDTSTSGSGRVFAATGLLAALAVFWYFQGQPAFRKSDVAQRAQRAQDATPAAQEAIPAKSIAVLAFDDLSPAHDQGYFSDGMSEEILNALAQVQDLKVAGRTSSFYYKDHPADLRTMGNALGVANILEGSVRKQGDKVRITAQLIRVADDSHLWSHAYDGDVSDVFALQENIARAITDQLQVVLVGEQKTRLVAVATTNPQAHALYLQATDALNKRDYQRMGEAIGWLQQAIELDPKFARAHSRLAMIHVVGQARFGASFAEVEPQARLALALDPSDAEAYVAIALLATKQRRFLDGRAAIDRALALAPNDAAVRLYAGEISVTDGYIRQGIAHLDRALAIDPKMPNALYWRGRQYLHAGDLDSAERMFKQAQDLGLSFADNGLGAVAIQRGDFARARAVLGPFIIANAASTDCPKDPAVNVPIYLDGVLGGDAAARGKAVAVLDACLAAKPVTTPAIVPLGLMRLDRPARALAIAAPGPTSDDFGFFMDFWGPRGRDARRLPEFPAFARKLGFHALWDRYGPPDACAKNAAGDYVCAR